MGLIIKPVGAFPPLQFESIAMKSKFYWYLDPTEDEIDNIWSSGFLTVDANVLLDLYRYHDQTRESILEAIASFGGRVWISSQAAQEFFRNRKEVITSAEKVFRDATVSMSELTKSIDSSMATMRSYRLVPRKDLDDLADDLQQAVSKGLAAIEMAKKNHPDYLHEDDILDRIVKTFDDRVGATPSIEEMAEMLQEGAVRFKDKRPPGYMDQSKEGERAYGDFFLWRQILNHSKNIKKPIILVTSERKEDWWEKHSGKTVGPRAELIEEATTYAGQRIIIYQTEFFIQEASKRSGRSIDKSAVEEIRELSANRSSVKIDFGVVHVSQAVDESDIWDNSGIISIELTRPVPALTGSGALSPQMEGVPQVSVELISVPIDAPSILLRSATGTNFDFNVHIKSGEKGKLLPVGTYSVKYKASCWDAFVDELLSSGPDQDQVT